VTFTAYWRAFVVGKRFPKHQKVFVTWTLITALIVAALVAYQPMQALLLFVLPMITTMLFTAWVTYDHHAGLETDSPFDGSFNTLNKRFNIITGNLGFHTAHHLKQSVHWSKLPELHRQIAHKIPAHLFRKSEFSLLLGTAETYYGVPDAPADDNVSLIKPVMGAARERSAIAAQSRASVPAPAQRDVA
jgi:fatty acid desaturase